MFKISTFLICLFLLFFAQDLKSQDDPYLLKEIKASAEVNSLIFHPDGDKIIAGLQDGSLEIIELESEKSILSFEEHWKGIADVEVEPKGKFFATAGDNNIKVWLMDGTEVSRLTKHTTTVHSIDIDPSGKYLVSGAINKNIFFWEIATGEIVHYLKGHTDVAMAVTFSPDGSLIASGSGDNTIRLWKTGTPNEIRKIPAHHKDIYDVEFSHDGRFIASCSKDKMIRIYDLKNNKLYKTLTGHKDFVLNIEFSPNDLHLLSCSADKEVRLWEIPTGNTLYSFIDHDEAIVDICFAPDGKSFASGSYDKTVKIWDYSPEIFVDYHYRDEVVEEMENYDIFLPRQKGESRKDYRSREEKANIKKKEIYDHFYQRYLQELKAGQLD